MPAEYRVLVIGDAFREVAIVRNDDERARPLVKEVLHGSEHVGVHVVRGLVENQNVGLIHEDDEQLKPALLTT